MFRKAARLTAVLGVVIALGAIAGATTASAVVVHLQESFNNWAVSGTLTPKKLGQPVQLPEGSTFNGSSELELVTGEHGMGRMSRARSPDTSSCRPLMRR